VDEAVDEWGVVPDDADGDNDVDDGADVGDIVLDAVVDVAHSSTRDMNVAGTYFTGPLEVSWTSKSPSIMLCSVSTRSFSMNAETIVVCLTLFADSETCFNAAPITALDFTTSEITASLNANRSVEYVMLNSNETRLNVPHGLAVVVVVDAVDDDDVVRSLSVVAVVIVERTLDVVEVEDVDTDDDETVCVDSSVDLVADAVELLVNCNVDDVTVTVDPSD